MNAHPRSFQGLSPRLARVPGAGGRSSGSHLRNKFAGRSPHKARQAPGSPDPGDSNAVQLHKTVRDPFDKADRARRDLARARLADSHRRGKRHGTADAIGRCECSDWAVDGDEGPGQGAPLLDVETEDPIRRVWHCHNRLCPWCCRARSVELREKIERAIAQKFTKARVPVLMTFTINDVAGEPIGDADERLTEGIGKLRRRKRWNENVAGGVVAIEAPRNRARGSWHIHAHVLADVDWYDADELRQDFRECLWGKDVVRLWEELKNPDIDEPTRIAIEDNLVGRGLSVRPMGGVNIQRLRKGVVEGLKYVTKGLDAMARLSDEELDELTNWMHGRRLVRTFGNLYDLELSDDDEDEPCVDSDELENATHAVNAVTGEIRPIECAQWKQDNDAVAELARRYASGLRTGRPKRFMLRPSSTAGPPESSIRRDTVSP